MSSDYLEAIARLKNKADLDLVRTWFEDRGFSTLPMEAGLLITGNGTLFENIFGMGAAVAKESRADRSLPVPSDLGQYVESVTVPYLRSIH